MDKIELLSPAGDYSCFEAALTSGADAVYLSGEKFGARAYAKNFSKEELIKAIDTAHIHEKKVFLTVNTLLKDDEISELYEYICPYYEAGLDGVIVQDMGVISYLRLNFPDMEVHASTQMAITGLEGIRLLEKEGVKRVVLAREVSLDEIKYIRNNSDMEIETFVHGALCYSYSGKCLFSSLVGGRSGNRGRCAGSCRQPYNGKYLLSTKDICCLSILPDLIDAGIASLKIEGRMKSPEYVAGVTSVYRKYIDIYYKYKDTLSIDKIKELYFSGKEFDKDLDILTRLYTRGGNSNGYYFRNNGKEMISINDASYKSDKGEIKEEFAKFNVDNRIKKSITGRVHIYPGDKISLSINNEITVYGGEALTAQNRPLDKETIEKQLKKTKDTEFEFSEIQFDISNNAFVKISDINELRRNAILEYSNYLLNKYRKNTTKNKKSSLDITSIEDEKHTEPTICAEISNEKQIYSLLSVEGIKRLYVPIELLLQNDRLLREIRKTNINIYVKFQSVIRHNFLVDNRKHILNILDATDGVLADSHELIYFLNEIGYSKDIVGDIHIYNLNRYSELKYREMGLRLLTVPVELSKKELYKRAIKGEELIVYGYLPMMISAQCINKTVNKCDKKGKYISLKDRTGAVFTAVNNCYSCSNVIYNNVPLSLHNEKEFIKRMNPSSLRMIFTFEGDKEVKDIAEAFIHTYCSIDNMYDFNVNLLSKGFTKGHLNRGVL